MGRLPKEESERRRNGRSRIRLKEIQEFLKLNKQTMANILGIPGPVYMQYEKGDYNKKSIMPIITMAKNGYIRGLSFKTNGRHLSGQHRLFTGVNLDP